MAFSVRYDASEPLGREEPTGVAAEQDVQVMQADPPHPLWSLVRSFEQSSYRERLLEQIFCAELMQAAWTAGYGPIELSRGFVDASGYDLIVECGAVMRHVQLKATRGRVTLHVDLERKPSACCILLVPSVVDDRISMRYRLFGSAAGLPLGLEELTKAKKPHWVKTADGMAKPDRPHHVVVPITRFTRALAIEELLEPLLSRPAPSDDPARRGFAELIE